MTNESTFLSTPFSRRQLLKGGAGVAAGAALAAYLPSSVRKAIAAGANPASFDLSQVKHVVLLMQENRSFDHYFGTLAGRARLRRPATPCGWPTGAPSSRSPTRTTPTPTCCRTTSTRRSRRRRPSRR